MANEEHSSTEIAATAEASAHHWGVQCLREDQKEAVVLFALGKGMLVLLHTGSGRFHFLKLFGAGEHMNIVSLVAGLLNKTRGQQTHRQQ